jgi:hypothetical protein
MAATISVCREASDVPAGFCSLVDLHHPIEHAGAACLKIHGVACITPVQMPLASANFEAAEIAFEAKSIVLTVTRARFSGANGRGGGTCTSAQKPDQTGQNISLHTLRLHAA